MKELGQLLKKTRTEKNLTLEDISSRTKIQLSILKRIEDGNSKDLPHAAHLRGFIRQYAKILGLDPDEVMKHFTLGEPPPSPTAMRITENASANESKTNVLWFRAPSKLITIAGVALTIILVIAIYSLSMKISSYNQEAVTAGEVSEPGNLDMQTSLTLPSTENTDEEPAETKATLAEPKMISVEAFDEVMINATWSTGKKEKIVLKTNRKHTFYYSEKIKLEISDAGVVNVITSKENLGIPGELGQSIELEFE